MFGPSTSRYLITRGLTICYEKLTQSTAMEQKDLDFRSLSPALPNLFFITSFTTQVGVISPDCLRHSLPMILIKSSER